MKIPGSDILQFYEIMRTMLILNNLITFGPN